MKRALKTASTSRSRHEIVRTKRFEKWLMSSTFTVGWSERDWTGPNLNSVIADYNSMSDLLEDIQALKVLDDLNDDLLVECARRVVDHGSRNRYYFRNSKR